MPEERSLQELECHLNLVQGTKRPPYVQEWKWLWNNPERGGSATNPACVSNRGEGQRMQE